MKRAGNYLFIPVVIFVIYMIGSAIFTRQMTGSLKVSSSEPNAVLTVSRDGYQSVVIGEGGSTIRLEPGEYRVGATSTNNQTFKIVTVEKQRTVEEFLDLAVSDEQRLESQKKSQKNLLIELLPYTGPSDSYEITYRFEFSATSAKPIIVIRSNNEQTKQSALEWIKTVGFNPDELDIEFTN